MYTCIYVAISNNLKLERWTLDILTSFCRDPFGGQSCVIKHQNSLRD